MATFKGIIALDIDGTVTQERHALEKEVAAYINHLIESNWLVIFLTGRTYTFARPILTTLKGHYFLSVQNGSALFAMPDLTCLRKHYLPVEILQEIDPLFQKKGIGLLVESGLENEDRCYYKPNDFTKKELEYLAFRMEISPEKWVALDSFEKMPIQEFAVGKYFAREEQALEIAEQIITQKNLSVVVIRDPFRAGFHLALANAPNTSKGRLLEEFRQMMGSSLPIIAAGDDYNDVEMLEKSTLRIMMQNGPEKLHALADIVAPPVSEQGIVQGLKMAIELLKEVQDGRDH